MNAEPQAEIAWYHRPVAIVLLAVLVLGPLALPLVWRTPAWGQRGRWIVTVLLFAYTVLLCWQVWVAVQFALEQMQELKP
jgi:hypothetical protein